MLLLVHNLGPWSYFLRHSAPAVLLAGLLFAHFQGQRGLWRSAYVVAITVGTILLLFATVPRIAALGLVATLAVIAESKEHDARCGSSVVSHVALSFVAVSFGEFLLPRLDRLGDTTSVLATGYLRSLTGHEFSVAPNAIGAAPVAFGSLLLLWRWRFAGGGFRLVMGVALPVLWFLSLPLVLLPQPSDATGTFFRGAIVGSFWLIAALIFDLLWATPLASESQTRSGEGRRCLWLSCGLAALVGVCLSGIPFLSLPQKRTATILVHNRGGLDWERPQFGKFGAFSGGMFGLLPLYARANGYDLDVLDNNAIEASDLENAQVLVLINSPKIWEGAEQQAVLDFVKRGGSLLVLGDHTDVFGLMRGFNSLLDEFGIYYRFDSAYHARDTWRGCFVAAPDVISAGWEKDSPGVAIGASLRLRKWARPLLTARYAFSDRGVRENVVGSFLGNYRYDEGEYLGDLAVVATAPYGRGRVVVWGDTSTFQGGLSYYFPKVIGPLFDWLSRPAAITERPAIRVTAALALFGIVAWLWWVRAPASYVAAVSGSMLAGMLIAWLASLPHLHVPIRIDKDTFLIDNSHLPAVGHYEAKVNPTGPLYTNLLRAGFRVADHDRWDREAIRKARGIAFVAPQKPLSDREVKDLLVGVRRRSSAPSTCRSPTGTRILPTVRSSRLYTSAVAWNRCERRQKTRSWLTSGTATATSSMFEMSGTSRARALDTALLAPGRLHAHGATPSTLSSGTFSNCLRRTANTTAFSVGSRPNRLARAPQRMHALARLLPRQHVPRLPHQRLPDVQAREAEFRRGSGDSDKILGPIV